MNATSIPVVLSTWSSLKNLQQSSYNGDYTLGGLVAALITNAVVCIDHWTVSTRGTSRSLQATPTEQLSGGELAAYLAGLKNGTVGDRKRYRMIQRQFRNLTGNRVDVQLNVTRQPPARASNPQHWIVVTGTQQHSIEPYLGEELEIELVTDNDLPLSRAGSGKAQILFWVTLMHAHANHVVLMDEPDHHLHPRLVGKVAQQLLETSAQFVGISHSPFMIPSGHLEYVRRVRLSEGQSVVSSPITPDVVHDLVLRKRGLEADDRLFLYANAVVFVEGLNDAEALRQWLGPDFLVKHGIEVRACVGKSQLVPMMRLADYFGIPNIGVWDFDVLLSTSKDDKNARNNELVLRQWSDYHMVDRSLVPLLHLDNQELYDRFPSHKVFLLGTKQAASLEQLFKSEWGAEWDDELQRDGYFGPITYREWARDHKWPKKWSAFVAPLLEAVKGLTAAR